MPSFHILQKEHKRRIHNRHLQKQIDKDTCVVGSDHLVHGQNDTAEKKNMQKRVVRCEAPCLHHGKLFGSIVDEKARIYRKKRNQIRQHQKHPGKKDRPLFPLPGNRIFNPVISSFTVQPSPQKKGTRRSNKPAEDK